MPMWFNSKILFDIYSSYCSSLEFVFKNTNVLIMRQIKIIDTEQQAEWMDTSYSPHYSVIAAMMSGAFSQPGTVQLHLILLIQSKNHIAVTAFLQYRHSNYHNIKTVKIVLTMKNSTDNLLLLKQQFRRVNLKQLRHYSHHSDSPFSVK